jgi:hypothetical protein
MKAKKDKVVNLAVITKEKISFFEGTTKVISVASSGLEAEHIEHYRVNPKQIEIDANAPVVEDTIEMTSIPVDVYNSMMNKEHFLDRFVLKGLSMDEWMEINYTPEKA